MNVDDNPITALPITTPVAPTVTTAGATPAITDGVAIPVDSAARSDTAVGNVPAEGILLPLDNVLPQNKGVPQTSTTAPNSLPQLPEPEQAEALDKEIQESLVPTVAGANVPGLSVPAAVQAVPLPSGKERGGYYIQAGVYADVADAERIAVDAVLAAPGEEVHVKPLKDSTMYRITVGPIVSQQHASDVSAKLSAAGLENFTVNVK